MMEWYRYASCALTITLLLQCVIPILTSSTRMHPAIYILTKLCREDWTAAVLPIVRWTRDKAHFGIVLRISLCEELYFFVRELKLTFLLF